MRTLPTEPLESGDAVELATSKPTQSVVSINAATAERWLERNVRNRRLSATVVERYRRDMADGRWAYAADPIRFSVSGNLLDGQHRLAARSLIPDGATPFLVVRGLPDDSQFFMDQGKKRTAGQQLELKGVKNSNALAAGVKVYIAWQEGLLFRDNKLTSFITAPQIEEWVADHSDRCLFVTSFFNAIRHADAPPSVGVAAALRFSELDAPMTMEFFQSIADGGKPVGNPITTLDKRLQKLRREGLKMSNRDILSLYILAWNAWRGGRELTKFQRPRGGSWNADNFPEPK